MGRPKNLDDYGVARRKLARVQSKDEEGRLKAAGTYGVDAYTAPSTTSVDVPKHQHFGPLIVSCEHVDLRPLPDSIVVYGDERCQRIALEAPVVPRAEVIDELFAAVHGGIAPLHDESWARAAPSRSVSSRCARARSSAMCLSALDARDTSTTRNN